MAEKVAEEGVPLGSNTTGCSLSLMGTGGNFEKRKAPIDEAVGKHAEVRNVGVVGLPGSIGVEVQAVYASIAESVEERNEREKDADGRRLSSCREGLVEMKLGSLTVSSCRVPSALCVI
eukprot:5704060-Pleurochrysis_carterae.AAC.1